jgi:hypothetical protein
MRMPTRHLTLVLTVLAAASLVATSCGSGSSLASDEAGDRAPEQRDVGTDDPDPDPPPEQEREFEFSQPATIGESIFVANRTLNSVAIINTASLSITTVDVGFEPTTVVGPDPEYADDNAARAVVLNQGSSTATVIDPETLEPTSYDVLDASNAVAMDPTGRRAIFWYDNDASGASEATGDLSSISVLKTSESTTQAHRVAVGFHVRKVLFSDDGSTALVWTDDGISRIDLDALSADGVSPPTPLLPADLRGQVDSPDDVFATSTGRYVAARLPTRQALVVLDTQNRDQHVIDMPSTPTDLDIIPGGSPAAWAMLPAQDDAVRITIPEGVEQLVAAQAADDPANHTDTGVSSDAGSGSDVSMTDAGPTNDTGVMADAGSAGGTWPPGAPLEGVDIFDISVPGLGAASMNAGPDAATDTALLYTTTGSETRVVVLNLENGDQQRLALQKKVRGATPAPGAGSYVIFNQKQPGDIPPDATPGDPEYVAKSWGITALDASSGASRLLLTQFKPGPATLWRPPTGATGDPSVFVAYEPPPANTDAEELPETQRDVIGLNLRTFRHRTYRMPTIPVSIGAIGSERLVYVNQRHPQGRMTFIEVGTDQTRTVTGYQLNSRIR